MKSVDRKGYALVGFSAIPAKFHETYSKSGYVGFTIFSLNFTVIAELPTSTYSFTKTALF